MRDFPPTIPQAYLNTSYVMSLLQSQNIITRFIRRFTSTLLTCPAQALKMNCPHMSFLNFEWFNIRPISIGNSIPTISHKYFFQSPGLRVCRMLVDFFYIHSNWMPKSHLLLSRWNSKVTLDAIISSKSNGSRRDQLQYTNVCYNEFK